MLPAGNLFTGCQNEGAWNVPYAPLCVNNKGSNLILPSDRLSRNNLFDSASEKRLF